MICPQCRAEGPAGARFCSSCGHQLDVVGDQRRVATVLFADLVGFTSLSETRDPEAVKGLVDQCFTRLADDIESFGGRVDKVVGDAIMALFGAPVAHEDDAERAVRCALRMQETIRVLAPDVDAELGLRIGVNTGEVLVGAVSGGGEYTAMGDVVNVASRLQAAAPPGGVLVGPATYAATEAAVSYEATDPVSAKGKLAPVRAFLARAAPMPPGHRDRRDRAPLIGRAAERALLTRLFDTAADRGRAALVVLQGEAGMGKTRLAEELVRHSVERDGALVLRGRCVPYGEANPWWPVAEAIRHPVGLAADAPRDVARDRLWPLVAQALEGLGRSDETDRVVTGLLHLLGHEGVLRGIDATRAREEAMRSVLALAEGQCARQPVVMMVSDLHWADATVLDFVDTIVTRLSRRRFVLLATARDSLRERWHPTAVTTNSAILHLDPLSVDASRQLLRALSGGGLHPSLVDLLVSRAGGNPFYLEELVTLVTDAGMRDVSQLLAADATVLPTSLQGLVAARLDGLPVAHRGVIDDAAVLGRASKVDALVTMSVVKRGISVDEGMALVDDLVSGEFLVVDGGEYSFRSDVIREVAYSTLTKADRARSHAGIAAWIEQHRDPNLDWVTQDIAHHYAAAAELATDVGAVRGVPDDVGERAVRWLRSALDMAQAADSRSTVVSVSSRLLALLASDDPERHQVLRARSSALASTGRLEAAVVDARDALAQARVLDDASGQAAAILLLGNLDHQRLALDDARRHLVDAKERFRSLADLGGQGEALRLLGMVELMAGDGAAADSHLLAALAHFESAGDRSGEAWVLQNLSWSAYTSGRIEEASARIDEALATFRELGDAGGVTWSSGMLAWVRFHQGRNDEARALCEAVLVDARDRGERWGEAMMTILRGVLALWEGETPLAIEHLRHADALFDEIGDRFGVVDARASLGRALVMSGAVADGLDLLRAAWRSTSHGPLAGRRDYAASALLSAVVTLGDVEAGREVLSSVGSAGGPADLALAVALHHVQAGDVAPALAIVDAIPEDRGYVPASRALVLAVAGRHDEACAAAERVMTLGHSYFDRFLGDLGAALALAGLGRPDEARARLAATADVVDATGDRVAQAVVRLADAAIAESADRPDAAGVRRVAEMRLTELAVAGAGWRRLLDMAVRPVTAS